MYGKPPVSKRTRFFIASYNVANAAKQEFVIRAEGAKGHTKEACCCREPEPGTHGDTEAEQPFSSRNGMS